MNKPSDMLRRLAAAAALGTFAVTSAAGAAPVIRAQIDVEGDFKLIGNTLAHECGNSPGNNDVPIVGTIGSTGPGTNACSTSANVSDQSPDLFWRSDYLSAGAVTADLTLGASQARSTAWLDIDPAQTVIYARLYWAALSPDATADDSVVLDRPGGFSSIITADVQITSPTTPPATVYESSADVTDLVIANGTGAYRINGIKSVDLRNVAVDQAFAAWSLVVFYAEAGEPLRQLTLFDGLERSDTTINISGFLVPQNPTDAKFGIVAYNGDGQTGGDTLTFNTTQVLDGTGSNDFFNGSKMWLGSPVSTVGDLPQLSGLNLSHAGVDIDVVDVSPLITAGDTTASITAKPGGDGDIVVGAVVTSIPTFKPNYNDSTKTATDLNGDELVVGDVLRYTLDIVNTGNDPAIDVIFEDVIPDGLTYLADSIEVLTGSNAGPISDLPGDDEGEFDAPLNTVRIRLGTGADAVNGGGMGIGESITVQFDVTVDGTAVGTISNQGVIFATGQNGAPETTFTSTDPVTPGPTDVVVDECAQDSDCPLGRPFCLIAVPDDEPNVCVECLVNANCGGTTPRCELDNSCQACVDDGDCDVDANAPACQPSGACSECSATNDLLCAGTNPICLVTSGTCGCTDTDGDSECGGPNSGTICSGPAGSCVPGCFVGVGGRNDCALTSICSEPGGLRGTCAPQACLTDTDCADPTPYCQDVGGGVLECVACADDTTFACTGSNAGSVCDEASFSCVECCLGCPGDKEQNCSASQTGAICLPTDTCGCAVDADCGSVTSGRVCDAAGTEECAIGCRGTGGNGCPVTLVCTSTDATIGTCVDCVSDTDCGGATPRCEVATNTCVGCLSNADCAGATPACNAGVCEACSSDADCTEDAARPACQLSGPKVGQCTECSGTNLTLCNPTTEPICLVGGATAGTCGCTDTDGDSECGGPTSGRICSGPAGQCVDGCSTSPSRNDCPATDYCSNQSGAIGSCLPHDCTSDADCLTAPDLTCDLSPLPHVCVECLDNGDCSAPLVCNTAAQVCVGCTSDFDCVTAPNNTCNTATQQCVDCLDNSGCNAPEVCDTTNLVCVGCLADADCLTAPNNSCDTGTNTCVDCTDNAGCNAPDVCDTTAQLCVGCVTDDDCTTAPNNSCDTSTNTCVDCTDNAGCTAPEVCVGCVTDDDCTSAPNNTCDTSTNTCVDCTDNAGCTAPEVCDTTAQVCVGCVTNDDCTTPPVCDTSDNTCVGCVTSDDCAAGTTCDTASQLCVGCVTDADCIAPQVCDTATQECVACIEDADCTTAPNNTCDTAARQCVDCLDDAGCDGTDVCDIARQTCVGCLVNADCTVAPTNTCDTSSNTCVECTTDDTSACSVDGAGAACLEATSTCGCTEDADCGATDSGRICDAASSTCTEGCRGTGGNGCPAGEACSSATDEAGVCGPLGNNNVVEGGGCACSTPARRAPATPYGLCAAALLGLAVSRRRRRAA